MQNNPNLPVFSGDDFKWKKGRGHSTLSRLSVHGHSFPRSFYIRSPKSGKTMLFETDNTTMEANEFFDGEATAYHDAAGLGIKVQIWC